MSRTAALLLATPLLLAACGEDNKPAAKPSPTPPPAVVNVTVGLNDPQDPNVAVLAFLPARITVAVGEKVHWTVKGPEPHSVTFFPAGQQPPTPDKAGPFFKPSPLAVPFDGTQLANSGLGPLGPGGPLTFDLTFAKTGTYNYVCVIHPQMPGTVEVAAAAAAEQQAAIDARAQAEQTQWLAEGRAAKQQLTSTPPKQTRSPDGTTTWQITTGATTAHTDILAFGPAAANVKKGDKIVFVNDSGAPHTATFPGGKPVPQDPESAEAMKPAPGGSPQVLKAGVFYNTGWLPPNAPPGGGPPLAVRSFTFTVPAAGSYAYVCILHVPSAMTGTITAT